MKEKIATIDCTPKWSQIYGTLKLFLTDGNKEQKEYALDQLKRLCDIADAYVKLANKKS